MNTVPDWHAKTVEETLSALQTTPSGLNENDVNQRFGDVGYNKLPEEKRKHVFLRFLSHFHNILIYIVAYSACCQLVSGQCVWCF
jgi:magnesium-transporting ATPase (P-type)